jgi:hypothetical protein
VADAIEFVSLFIVVMGFWTCLGVAFSLSLIHLQEGIAPSKPRGQLPEMGWPDANCFFPWRLWW